MSIKLPLREKCLSMLREEGTPPNIIQHTLSVERVAVFLANALSQKGIKVDVELVSRGALLHDIKKWESITNNADIRHGELGKKIFQKKYPRLADIISNHMLGAILHGLQTWEEKIVSYADKRVKHDKIVGLKERFCDLDKRYPVKNPEERELIREAFFHLEEELFASLDFRPDDIAALLVNVEQ